MLQPGACSPSRSVVSKKVMRGFSMGLRLRVQQRTMLSSRKIISQSYNSSAIISISYSISGRGLAGRSGSDVDFFQLETFLAVAQTGSFSAAAAQGHRTRPAGGDRKSTRLN